jgi:hypothetical protein
LLPICPFHAQLTCATQPNLSLPTPPPQAKRQRKYNYSQPQRFTYANAMHGDDAAHIDFKHAMNYVTICVVMGHGPQLARPGCPKPSIAWHGGSTATHPAKIFGSMMLDLRYPLATQLPRRWVPLPSQQGDWVSEASPSHVTLPGRQWECHWQGHRARKSAPWAQHPCSQEPQCPPHELL